MEALLHQKKKFSVNFSKANTKICLSLHYSADNSYLFVNEKEIDRIDISKIIDLTKINKSKEWFFNHGFKEKDSVCNGFHDLTMLCLNVSDIAIITVKNVDYCCIIHCISRSEGITLSKNSVLLKIVDIYKKYCLNFQSIESSFFTFDIMDIYMSLNITTGTVMKNLEITKFVHDHLH